MSRQATRLEILEQPHDLDDIEDMAVQLATLAGAEIVRTFGRIFTVRYKTGDAGKLSVRDPVSEVDRHVEKLFRTRLAERFPSHDIIGEEMDERPGRGQDCVWAVDPIDGTTNFVNGFPMFAASIGVLHSGVPVAGAVWCSVSHALRAGVYHAAAGGKLRFEGDDVTPKVNADVLRRLAGVPIAADADEAGWETRKTGSAALECALVASGLLEVARFASPHILDVAGGIALVRAGGRVVREHDGIHWRPMGRFAPSPAIRRCPRLARVAAPHRGRDEKRRGDYVRQGRRLSAIALSSCNDYWDLYLAGQEKHGGEAANHHAGEQNRPLRRLERTDPAVRHHVGEH
jgi:myo-inositol-1(or 4)-monophosphatase